MCSSNTRKIARGNTFLITITENWDLHVSSEEIACYSNLNDEMIGVIKQF